MQLSEKQQLAFNKYILGENIFITGAGGTGKSELIKKIVESSKNFNKNIQVCALTGCAALLLKCGAKTIHSWAGIGLANKDQESIIRSTFNNKYKKKRWKSVDILIIDEVSMMSKQLFELLEAIGRKCRKNENYFGGIQVIFSGDFFQLPPISNSENEDDHKFCFESELWNKVFSSQIYFTKIFRQQENIYAKILNQIRCGKISKNSIQKLSQCINKKYDSGCIVPTKLFPTKIKVNKLNNKEMSVLKNEEFKFEIQKCSEDELSLSEQDKEIMKFVTNDMREHEYNFLKNNINCEQNIILKVGAQVMCIVNLDMDSEKPICNGSQGIIKGFNYKNNPIVEFKNGGVKTIGPHIWQHESFPGIAIKQIPLILAWALTIHKSQGSTLDCAEIDIGSGIFECGQTYVALSRVKSLDGLYLKSFDVNKIKVNKKVCNFYNLLQI